METSDDDEVEVCQEIEIESASSKCMDTEEDESVKSVKRLVMRALSSGGDAADAVKY